MKIVVIGGSALIGSKLVTRLKEDGHEALATVAVGAPLNGTIEVAGPEQFRLDALIRRGLRARNDPREVMAEPQARYFGAELRERTLVPDAGARLGETRFEEWLSRSAVRT